MQSWDNEARPRVVVVEDDSAVAAGVVQALRRAGFDVELATDGEAALRIIDDHTALVVLDLMLPERDGFDVLRAVRGRSAVPIIVVSARTELGDRLKAFDLGAIDYLPKPFFVDELIARAQTRLARGTTKPRMIVAGGLRIELDGHRVEVDGHEVHLTPTEHAILRYVAERAWRAVSRADLAAALRDFHDADPRNIDAHVSRLRRKLGSAAKVLTTVWGHGYRFDPRRATGEATRE